MYLMGQTSLALRCLQLHSLIRSRQHLCTSSRNNSYKMGKKNPKGAVKGAGQNVARKTQSASKVPHSLNIVAIGTGGPGTPRCVLLTSEYTRYMFNCGVGTQRLVSMNKSLRSTAYTKISGLENIFITHKSWDNTGGLLGLAMLLEGQKNPEVKGHSYRLAQEAKGADRQQRPQIPSLKLFGPEGVEKITMMARKFSEKANMNIIRQAGVFEDSSMQISPAIFHRHPPVSDSIQDEEAAEPSSKKSKVDPPEPHEVPNNEAYAYICKAKPPLPKINVEKCLDAGITLGPMVGQLQRGNSIVLEDGKVVYPEQVTDVPTSKNHPFLILECPSEEFFPDLAACTKINEHRVPEAKDKFGLVVHMTSSKIFKSEDYQNWMAGFGPDTDHLVINEDSGAADLTRVRHHQARLNLAHGSIFPVLPEVHLDSQLGSDHKGIDATGSQTVRQACSGLMYALRGKQLGFQIESDGLDLMEMQNSVLQIPEIKSEVEKLKTLEPDSKEGGGNRYPKVVFLGTGSSEPNRIRAQSCILVQLSKHSVIMLDCGEDSYSQLYRFYGPEKSNSILRKLKAIFISHLHGDHHLGLISILKERKRAFDVKAIPFTPAFLMAPVQIRRWLVFYQNELEPVAHLFRFCNHQKIENSYDRLPIDVATEKDFMENLALVKYRSVPVIHCLNAFGCAFTHSNGFKLVYSGDTRPCDALCTAGEDCDLLIHEATHEDDLLAHAQASKHSTISEALDVGKRMRAKHIILTHFSQRYSHMVPVNGLALPANMGLAFDNMQVNPQSLPVLPKLIPALTSLFDDKLQKLELRTLKRNRE